jgi:DnaJ-class molecular chaperone
VRTQREHGVTLQQIATCAECAGRGRIIDTPCPQCRSKGNVVQDEVLTVRIPVGVEEQTALRVPGHGLPADRPGPPPGDLYVIVRTAADAPFERHGRDLYRIETIDVVDAVLGTSLDIPTLDASKLALVDILASNVSNGYTLICSYRQPPLIVVNVGFHLPRLPGCQVVLWLAAKGPRILQRDAEVRRDRRVHSI